MDNRITITDVMHKIGQVIESHRNKENLTQFELSERINVSRLTIINLEKGKGSNTLTVLKILKYFDLLHDLDVSFNLMLEKAAEDENLNEINLYE